MKDYNYWIKRGKIWGTVGAALVSIIALIAIMLLWMHISFDMHWSLEWLALAVISFMILSAGIGISAYLGRTLYLRAVSPFHKFERISSNTYSQRSTLSSEIATTLSDINSKLSQIENLFKTGKDNNKLISAPPQAFIDKCESICHDTRESAIIIYDRCVFWRNKQLSSHKLSAIKNKSKLDFQSLYNSLEDLIDKTEDLMIKQDNWDSLHNEIDICLNLADRIKKDSLVE